MMLDSGNRLLIRFREVLEIEDVAVEFDTAAC